MKCMKEECEGVLEHTDTDNRDEWMEQRYVCKTCGQIHVLRTEFQTQSSLIENQELNMED